MRFVIKVECEKKSTSKIKFIYSLEWITFRVCMCTEKRTMNKWVNRTTIHRFKLHVLFIYLNSVNSIDNFSHWLQAKAKWILYVWSVDVKAFPTQTANQVHFEEHSNWMAARIVNWTEKISRSLTVLIYWRYWHKVLLQYHSLARLGKTLAGSSATNCDDDYEGRNAFDQIQNQNRLCHRWRLPSIFSRLSMIIDTTFLCSKISKLIRLVPDIKNLGNVFLLDYLPYWLWFFSLYTFKMENPSAHFKMISR